jgi:myo-inositol catabolism protein IolC
MSRVEHWIDGAAPLPGYAGFAVGRSIWEEAILGLNGGKLRRSEAVDDISARYRTLIDTYDEARRKVGPS